MDKFIRDKVRVTCENLAGLCDGVISEIPELLYIETPYKSGHVYPQPDDSWRKLTRSERLSGKDAHFWLCADVKTPAAKDGYEFAMELMTGKDGNGHALNPQGLVYLNGKIVQGIDINHRRVLLEADTQYRIMIYFYVGMIDIPVEVNMNLVEIDTRVRELYYDLKVPYDALGCFEEGDYLYVKTLACLERACNLLDFRAGKTEAFYAGLAAARDYLRTDYYGKEWGNTDAVVSYIGHTHIDVAWLWTLAQTREKAQRSFATVLNLMSQYPEYMFMSSQPQLYEYLKEEEPELYERVREMVKAGRWEVEGAMWLEADCNLSSGESLVRQILYGKRFIKEEFGIDSRVLWLPDVFGYSAALPQILKKSGVDKFVTSKISWSESNILPYDSFMWEGIDGTEIFTYFLTAQNHGNSGLPLAQTTYVGTVSPSMHLGTWERYQQKEYNNEAIVTFGFGDGGGGPTAEMLEAFRRLEYGVPGLPAAKMTFANDFLDRVSRNFDENCKLTGRTPKWVGELYLEMHRGTYTSIAKNKRYNRKCEFLCQEAETLSVIDMVKNDGDFDRDTLRRSWKTLLLNQFHDIIPGSSIKEVYEDSDRQYEQVKAEVGAIKDGKLEKLARNMPRGGIMVYNPNSFEASGYVDYDSGKIYAENIPAMGWRVIDEQPAEAVSVSERQLESGHYLIKFDDNMNIASIFDKDNGREIVAAGTAANKLAVFEDYPRAYDNWEITGYYRVKRWDIDDVNSVKTFSGNGCGGVIIERKYMSSTLVQKITIYSESRRIDFETTADWHENHVLLKALFPTTVHTARATYDIQFGNTERPTHQNTSWDAAKFEVCAHKWGDLSEDGYGVSLLNDCKYGYSAIGSELDLTLIKCGTYPNPEADQGEHHFTYSLYPHAEDFRRGGTVREAYLLNRPMSAYKCAGGGALPESYSAVSVDCENICIETVKPAENGDGVIIRLFDCWDRKSKPTLKLGFNAKSIALCDLTENPTEELGGGDEVTLDVKNFEIVTLLVRI